MNAQQTMPSDVYVAGPSLQMIDQPVDCSATLSNLFPTTPQQQIREDEVKKIVCPVFFVDSLFNLKIVMILFGYVGFAFS